MAPDLRVVGPGDQPDPRAISYQVIVDDLTAVRNSVVECQAEAAAAGEDDAEGAGLRASLGQLLAHVDIVIGLAQDLMRQL